MLRAIFALALLATMLPVALAAAAPFDVQRDKDGVTILHNGKMMARYLIKSGNKPIIWPIISPDGEEVTRQYPMRDAGPLERADHPHHRSFWFTHGDVNGISFWHEGENTGEIVHREFVDVRGGETAVIITRDDWVGPQGERICADVRKHTFATDGNHIWIDFDTTVSAPDTAATFGDTKEGCFGVRVAGGMKVDAKQDGHIVNSEGQRDGEAWGKAAAWCDYYGPVNGKTNGIAILNHPKSFRFPTYWHVRTYGLFTANPFGLSNFTKAPQGTGNHTLQPGESFALHYRVLIHRGKTEEAKIAEAFQQYSQTKPEAPQ